MVQIETQSHGRSLPSQTCARQILETVPLVMRLLRSIAGTHAGGLSVPQLRALALLSSRPGASLSDVAAHLDVATPTASTLVDRLVRKGYIQRQDDPFERRRVILTITKVGKEAFEDSRTHAQDFLSQLLLQEDSERLSKIIEGLTLLAQAAKSYNIEKKAAHSSTSQ